MQTLPDLRCSRLHVCACLQRLCLTHQLQRARRDDRSLASA
jgi:hypothetical protein